MISIIIVNYNTRELLRQCLASVETHCPAAEVIVVDNGSRDGSVAMLTEMFPRVQVIELGYNAGFAAANNAGIQRARGEFIVLLNSDTVLEDDALDRCADWMRSRPRLGAASPALMGSDGRPQQCLYPFTSLRMLVREALRQGYGPAAEEGWLAGTCLMLRARALAEIGGTLDDQFWMYWEDADLSARLLHKGWEVEPYRDAQIIHYGGASGGGPDAARRPDLHAWFTYGKHRWFAKHRPWWEAAGVWCLDAFDVGRKFLRGIVHQPRRASEWAHARVVALTLGRRLAGFAPPRPGR